MKMIFVLPLVSVLFGANAMANFQLSQSKKAVVCYGPDNQSLELDATRTTVKYEVEGETRGPAKIVGVNTDNRTFITYTTPELTLTLSNAGDTFLYNGDQDPTDVECK